MRRERRAANIQKMKRPVWNVEMQIDELFLHGFPATDRYVIGDALTSELGQLFVERQAELSSTRDAHIPVLNAGQVTLPSNAKPASVGAQVADTVYGSVSRVSGGNQR